MDHVDSAGRVVPPLAVRALNRIAFGPAAGDVERFLALGPNDRVRLRRWVEQQLRPEAIDDAPLAAQLAALGFTTLDKSFEQLHAEHAGSSDYTVRERPVDEVARAAFVRAVHGRRQLVEVLADFWHNHFNAYGPDDSAAPLWPDWDRTIRQHVLGNFRTFLEAVGRHPVMLVYLDNFSNTNAGPNENYARELFELHGLGAENYLGLRPQGAVRRRGRTPVGYVDGDVYEAARAFTGWSIDAASGTFTYRSAHHDRFQKIVLGRQLPPDQPALKDGQDVYDLIAFHPGTATYIARKLCRRLVADDPPERLVRRVARVFRRARRRPDQLRRTVRAILLSPEFRTTWGAKTKRPFETAVSAMRATGADVDFRFRSDPATEVPADGFFYRFQRTGQPLFQWRPPNGYPDRQAPWLASTPLVQTWRLLLWLCAAEQNGLYYMRIVENTPATLRSATQLADHWIGRVFGHAARPEIREQAILFLSEGRDPALPLPIDDDVDARNRLRSMVSLLLLTPEFLIR